mgnify:CR=1 FL=1
MGGGLSGGNTNSTAEFNIYNDPPLATGISTSKNSVSFRALAVVFSTSTLAPTVLKSRTSKLGLEIRDYMKEKDILIGVENGVAQFSFGYFNTRPQVKETGVGSSFLDFHISAYSAQKSYI